MNRYCVALLGLGAMSAAASAEPLTLADADMDRVTAGKSGKGSEGTAASATTEPVANAVTVFETETVVNGTAEETVTATEDGSTATATAKATADPGVATVTVEASVSPGMSRSSSTSTAVSSTWVWRGR